MAGMMRLIGKVKEKIKYNQRGKLNHDRHLQHKARIIWKNKATHHWMHKEARPWWATPYAFSPTVCYQLSSPRPSGWWPSFLECKEASDATDMIVATIMHKLNPVLDIMDHVANIAILCHPSSGWVSHIQTGPLALRKWWHSISVAQSSTIYGTLLSSITIASIKPSASIRFASIWADHPHTTSSAHFHKLSHLPGTSEPCPNKQSLSLWREDVRQGATWRQ